MSPAVLEGEEMTNRSKIILGLLKSIRDASGLSLSVIASDYMSCKYCPIDKARCMYKSRCNCHKMTSEFLKEDSKNE